MKSELLVAFTVRPLLALLSRTFFQPDEYYQSLEPAHQFVFGYGLLTWEWQPENAIRSFLHPSLYAIPYWCLSRLGLDDTLALIYVPKLLGGLLAAVGDYGTYLLALKVFDVDCARSALFLSLINPYNALALSRSLSNSLETSLTAVALSLWPFYRTRYLDTYFTLLPSLSAAALACMIRPLNAILWLVLMTFRMLKPLQFRREAYEPPVWFVDILQIGLVGLLSFGLMITVESYYYERWVFTPLNFIRTNLSPVSLFYGRNPWHYHVAQSFPILCGPAILASVRGLSGSLRGMNGHAARDMAYTALIVTAIYSLAGHKEWRFLHPILPILNVLAAKTLVDDHRRSARRAKEAHSNSAITSPPPVSSYLPISRMTGTILATISLPVCIYVLFFHGQAQISALIHLRTLRSEQIESVGFLMPCHSTPWQAYFHRRDLDEPANLWGLSCEPPLASVQSSGYLAGLFSRQCQTDANVGGCHEQEDLSSYSDETTQFYDDPVQFLENRLIKPDSSLRSLSASDTPWPRPWPRHFLLFDSLLAVEGQFTNGTTVSMERYLQAQAYREVWTSGWNGWEGDDKRQGEIKILRRTENIS